MVPPFKDSKSFILYLQCAFPLNQAPDLITPHTHSIGLPSMSTGKLATLSLPSNTTAPPTTPPLDDIENLFVTLISHPGVKNIAAIGVENKKLRKEYTDLERDNAHTLSQIARLQTSLDAARKQGEDASKRLQDAVKQKQAVECQYLEAKKKLADNEAQLSGERERMQQQIDAMQQELSEETDKLQRLSSFSTKMVSITANVKQICSIMDYIRTSAVKLAETYLCDDLPLNGVNWSAIKSHTALNVTDQIFPLPVSNSPIAKHMRVAAFLAVLGYEMRNSIFQPVYLLHDSSEFNEFLDNLAEENEEAEAHLRSVLFRTLSEYKINTDSVGTKCTQSVVGTVASCTEGFVLEAKRQPFVSELKAYCAKACKEWEYIQRLERRVEFETDPEDDDLKNKKYWLPLSTKSSCPPETSPLKTHSNGSSSMNTSSKNHKGGASSGMSSPPQTPVEATSLLDVLVVWPAVTTEQVRDTAILSLGYFVTAGDIASAMREQRELSASKDQHKAARDSRRKSRAMSIASHSVGENGSVAGRSVSFLSAQVGNGSRGS
ncbi:hypothetical protein QBC41DRAFT_327930 [Cercophora samala]|uniref:Uncharacterized protein n=1 Tax=Cercophora samala TaxID=330535 RepID=A0AA39Z757_9PEZI|nr:hypothetical protein QBC41DRAFT_327930 [Cercophora samala]